MLASFPDKRAAKRRLSQLQARYPLPGRATLAQTFLERVVVAKLELFMVGCAAQLPGVGSAVGAAADSCGYPVDRAYFELLERVGMFLARKRRAPLPLRDHEGNRRGLCPASRVFPSDAKPEQVRASLSNGVALHLGWRAACDSALRELVERDRVLRSFRGEFPPRRVANLDDALVRKLGPYQLESYAFAPTRARLTHQVGGVFLFPRDPRHPLAYGFAAGLDIEQALAAASGEALQRLAFLWGETLPASPPSAAPTPDFHQEHYLYPPHQRLLRRWLGGRWPAQGTPARAVFDGESVQFVDLTPRGLTGSLVIAKARSPRALTLRFGVRSVHTVPHPIP